MAGLPAGPDDVFQIGARLARRRQCAAHQLANELERLVALCGGSGGLRELDQIGRGDELLQLLGRQAAGAELPRRLQKLGAGAFQRLETVALAEVDPGDFREPEIDLPCAPVRGEVLSPKRFEGGEGANVQRSGRRLNRWAQLSPLDCAVDGVPEKCDRRSAGQCPQKTVAANRDVLGGLDVPQFFPSFGAGRQRAGALNGDSRDDEVARTIRIDDLEGEVGQLVLPQPKKGKLQNERGGGAVLGIDAISRLGQKLEWSVFRGRPQLVALRERMPNDDLVGEGLAQSDAIRLCATAERERPQRLARSKGRAWPGVSR